MRVDNNQSINFGTIHFSDNAVRALSKRLSEKKFVHEIPSVINSHSKNPISIRIDSLEDFSRLTCKVTIPDTNKQNVLFEYTDKESIFEKIFSNPIKYIKKVCASANDIANYLRQKSL